MTTSAQTPEKPRRYVILRHVDHEGTHYDLMIENGGVLWTWKFSECPSAFGPQQSRRINDHRPIYLDYEGPVSGNRGTVTRVDGGNCFVEQESPAGYLFRFAGTTLTGRFSLTSAGTDQSWAFRRLEA